MKNRIWVDFDECKIYMDRTFAKRSSNACSDEYAKLQEVRRDYPEFDVKIRTIKKNPKKETYAGLTYKYMEDYITSHGTTEEIAEMLGEFYELRLIAKCHKNGHGYPIIKKWFLGKYPDIEDFNNSAA